MLKKIIIVSIVGLFSVETASAISKADQIKGTNFDKGSDYHECFDNCRYHHRQALKWPRGHGKGMCVDICKKSENKGKKMIFNQNIVELAKKNDFFRKELVTGEHSQVVLMSIPVGQDIGQEVHKVDQTLIFVQGRGQAIINGNVSDVKANHLVFVPAGAQHNFKNTGSEDLKLFTIYAPAQHKPGTIAKTKPVQDED